MTRAPCNTLTRERRHARADGASSYDFSPGKQPPLRSARSCDGPQLGDHEDRRPRDTAKVFAGCKGAYDNGTSTRRHELRATHRRVRVARAGWIPAPGEACARGVARSATRCITRGSTCIVARPYRISRIRPPPAMWRAPSGGGSSSAPKPPRTGLSSPHGGLRLPIGTSLFARRLDRAIFAAIRVA
jgi:hypothetical protein